MHWSEQRDHEQYSVHQWKLTVDGCRREGFHIHSLEKFKITEENFEFFLTMKADSAFENVSLVQKMSDLWISKNFMLS